MPFDLVELFYYLFSVVIHCVYKFILRALLVILETIS